MLKKLFILPVRAYQILISPLLGKNCRFTPTCSQYMIEAIQEWGPLKGIYLGLRRIGKCHPWGPHGHDPVPKRAGRKNQKTVDRNSVLSDSHAVRDKHQNA